MLKTKKSNQKNQQATERECVINVTNLYHSYSKSDNYVKDSKSVQILLGIDLKVHAGESVAITGESGAGKSTLLNIVGGLTKANFSLAEFNALNQVNNKYNDINKNLHLANCNIANQNETKIASLRNKSIGFIFQEHHLLKDFTALENLIIPQRLHHNLSYQNAFKHAIHLMEKVGIQHRQNHLPQEMSGGECQRLATIRAIVCQPKIILADEPTGNLDDKNAKDAFALLLELVNQHNMAMVLVTHDKHLSRQCDITYHLQNGKLNIVL